MQSNFNISNWRRSLVVGFCVALATVSVHAASTVSIYDTTGDASSVSLSAGQTSFDIKLRLTTDQSFEGLSLYLKDQARNTSGASSFTLTQRSRDSNNPYTDPNTDDATFNDTTNAGRAVDNMTFDLGYTGGTKVAGTYEIVTLTVGTVPGIVASTYTLTLSALSNLTTVGGEASYDSLPLYTVTVVPEPAAISLLALSTLLLRRRTKRPEGN